MKRALMMALMAATLLLMVSSTMGQGGPTMGGGERVPPVQPGELEIPVDRDTEYSPAVDMPEYEIESELPTTPSFPCITSNGIPYEGESNKEIYHALGLTCMGFIHNDCRIVRYTMVTDWLNDNYDGDWSNAPCRIVHSVICYDPSDYEDMCICDCDYAGTQSGRICIIIWQTYGDDCTECNDFLDQLLAMPCPEKGSLGLDYDGFN